MHKLHYVALSAIAVGFLFVVLSYNWASLAGRGDYWSDEQFQKRKEAANVFHQMTYDMDAEEQSLEAAQERFRQADDELKAAREARDATARLLFWGGLVFCCAGIVVLAIPREEA